MDDDVRPVTKALVGDAYGPARGGSAANVVHNTIQCACMEQITTEHIRIGYHPPCMRRITVVLEEMT